MSDSLTAVPRAFWMESISIPALELGAAAGFSSCVLDMKHGVGMTADGADTLVALGRALGLRMFVRVAAATRAQIQHALDSGADGVILPQIETLEQASHAASLAKYPPRGKRGVGYGRTMFHKTDADFPERENDRTVCYVMIETPGALEQAEQIAALACVDGLFIGPADLSMTRGRGWPRATQQDIEDHRRIAAAARSQGKDWAMPATNRTTARFARENGAALIVVSDDLSALRVGFEHSLDQTAP